MFCKGLLKVYRHKDAYKQYGKAHDDYEDALKQDDQWIKEHRSEVEKNDSYALGGLVAMVPILAHRFN